MEICNRAVIVACTVFCTIPVAAELGKSPEGSECENHLSCGEGMLCQFEKKVCVKMCFTNEDCVHTGKCVDSACPDSTKEVKNRNAIGKGDEAKANKACSTPQDCGYSQDCLLGQCAGHCRSDDDCKEGTKCKHFNQANKYTKGAKESEGSGGNKLEVQHTKSGRCIKPKE